MNELLLDLFDHMTWADAEVHRAIESLPSAYGDKEFRERLHHMHLTQHAFLWIIGRQGDSFRMTTPEDFPSEGDLLLYAKDLHARIGELVRSLSESRLKEAIDVPWFRDPSFNVTVTQALLQVVMHSQHHRAQNASRFRALGGKPPTTDLIMWYWKKKPPPDWPENDLSTGSARR
ncbi:MAG TPA: DinB family protein [Bacteroidota bacterium]|nr:DinB family protein [Bacteroidota bacterium]